MTVRIAVISESPKHDGLIVRRIFGHLLGGTATFVDHPIERRVNSRRGVLEQAVLATRAVYLQTDADVLLIVADLDQDPVPRDDATLVDLTSDDCGHLDEPSLWCDLADAVRRGIRHLPATRPMSNNPLRFVVAVSVPAIEAWLLCPAWTEMKWRQHQSTYPDVNKQRSTKKAMKVNVYGEGADRRTPRPQQIESAVEDLISSGRVDQLPDAFPLGIGQVLEALKSIDAQS